MRVNTARVALAMLCVCVSLSFVSSAQATCVPNYVVKQGDSWWSIARSQGTSLKALLKLNVAKSSTVIRPRDEICVPVAEPTPIVQYTQQEVIRIIREIWPDELEDRAIAIARRESRLRPDAIGIPDGCCYGLFQIYYRWHRKWLSRRGVVEGSQLLDPYTNTRAAFWLYERSKGWSPWVSRSP